MKNRAKVTAFFMIVMLVLTTMTVFTAVSNVGASGEPRSRGTSPTLTNASVSPTSGNTNTLFTFYTKYTDSDGDWPNWVKLYIDSNQYSMSGLGGTPKSGLPYNYSTKLSAGTHYYYYYTTNNMTENARYPSTGNLSLMVNTTPPTPPTLTRQSVSPSTGNTNTTFTFSITYTDVNGDQPAIMYIIIDSTSYSMTYSSGSAKSGMVYTYQTKLTLGNHTYYFITNNTQSESARDPSSSTYLVSVTNIPQLPTLYGGNVYPSGGDTDTTFYFNVDYKDPGNNLNCWVYLIINSIKHNMTANGTDLINGIPYFYSTKLPAGNYTYHFQSHNTEAEIVNDPATGSYPLTVRAVTPPPGNKPQLYNAQVAPSKPLSNETINFTVQYKDLDNDAPKHVRLHIWITGTNSSYKGFDMNVTGTSYVKGVGCYIALSLSSANYTYYFATASKNTTVNEYFNTNQYHLYVGPGSNSRPYLLGGSVSPTSGTANKTIFKYDVIYQDGWYGAAKVSFVVIDNSLYTMTESKGDSGSAGIYYTYSTTLLAGNHNYYFLFSDGKVNITLPTSGTFSGPVVSGPSSNRAPTVSISVSPLSGDINTNFYFNSSASDPDNDILSYEWYFGDGFNATGKPDVTYMFSRAGNYTVTLTVRDPGSLSASASVKVQVTDSSKPPTNNPPVIITNLKSFMFVTKGTSLYISALSSYDPDSDPITFRWFLTHASYNFSTVYNVGAFNYSFNLPGNYTLSLEVSDGKLKATSTFTILCKQNTKLKPIARATVSVNGMSAFFSGASSYDTDGYITSYVWSLGSSTFNGMYMNYTFSNKGYKTATLVVMDNDGLTARTIIGFHIGRSTNDSKNRTWTNENTAIGSHVEVSGSVDGAKLTEINSEFGFKISIIESRENYLKFMVESESSTGRLIVMDVKDLFDIDRLNEIRTKMDDMEIERTDLETIIQTTGDKPMYYMVEDGNGFQLLVYIPHFSSHTLEVMINEAEPEYEPSSNEFNTNIWPVLIIFVIALVIIMILGFFQMKRKKESEYYHDFRVAEDKIQNGVHTKTEKEDSKNWDDYI